MSEDNPDNRRIGQRPPRDPKHAEAMKMYDKFEVETSHDVVKLLQGSVGMDKAQGSFLQLSLGCFSDWIIETLPEAKVGVATTPTSAADTATQMLDYVQNEIQAWMPESTAWKNHATTWYGELRSALHRTLLEEESSDDDNGTANSDKAHSSTEDNNGRERASSDETSCDIKNSVSSSLVETLNRNTQVLLDMNRRIGEMEKLVLQEREAWRAERQEMKAQMTEVSRLLKEALRQREFIAHSTQRREDQRREEESAVVDNADESNKNIHM